MYGDIQLASVPRSSSEAAAFKVSRREVNVRASVWVNHWAIDRVTNVREVPVKWPLLRVMHQKECHLRFTLANLSSLNAQGLVLSTSVLRSWGPSNTDYSWDSNVYLAYSRAVDRWRLFTVSDV